MEWLIFVLFIFLLLLFLIAFMMNAVKFFFKFFSAVAVIIGCMGAVFAILAFVQGSALTEDLQQPVLVFTDGQRVAGAALYYENIVVVDRQELTDEFSDLQKFATDQELTVPRSMLTVDVSVLNADTSGDYEDQVILYVDAFETTFGGDIFQGYIQSNITLYPEPFTFRLVRTQPFINPSFLINLVQDE